MQQDLLNMPLVELLRFRGIFEFSFDEYADVEEVVLSLFGKDSTQNSEVTSFQGIRQKWAKSFASNRLKGNYVSPTSLEPFVARYVVAINQAGAKTYYSCDGWHEKSSDELVVIFTDRASKLWHKIILEHIERTFSFGLPFHYDGLACVLPLPNSDSGKWEAYQRVNQLATYIEKNAEIFIRGKRCLIERVKGQKKNSLDEQTLYALMRNNTIVEPLI